MTQRLELVGGRRIARRAGVHGGPRHVAAALLAVPLLSACAGAPAMADRVHDYEGVVVERSLEYNVPVEFPVVFVRDDADPCGIIYVIDRDTRVIERRADGTLRARGEAAVLAGVRVRVWHGGVAESCPGQSGAERVEIIASRTDAS